MDLMGRATNMAEKFGVGTKHITNEGYEIEIVEKIDYNRRRIRFENGYEFTTNCSNINEGRIKNPYHPSVFGVGYLGGGDYRTNINNKDTLEYTVWHSMIKRCYSNKCQEKRPTYKGITVCEKWLNFQNFAKWYEDNYPKIHNVKFSLDKDLLQEVIENKIYSPTTCIFLPHNVNSFLANKQLNNTSGYVGVGWYKSSKKWVAKISLFGEDKLKHLGYFSTSESAYEVYKQARAIESEKVKSYLRSLNYLPEEIIQLVK